MKIGIIEATSRKELNPLLEKYVKEANLDNTNEVINFGIYSNSNVKLTYVQVAVLISILINSRAVDFIVTGCSSGQGMMLACNSLPELMCGYIPTPADAYLFAQINNGNVVSYSLGLNWGWAGEVNFAQTMKSLFSQPFGQGYPKKDADRKLHDSAEVKHLKKLSNKSLVEVLSACDRDFIKPILNYKPVYDYVMKYGKNDELRQMMKEYR